MEALTPCRMLVISTRDLRYRRSVTVMVAKKVMIAKIVEKVDKMVMVAKNIGDDCQKCW